MTFKLLLNYTFRRWSCDGDGKNKRIFGLKGITFRTNGKDKRGKEQKKKAGYIYRKKRQLRIRSLDEF